MRGQGRTTRGRTAWLPVLAGGLVLLTTLTASATALASPASQIAALNAQRAAHGIPADITEVPDWTEGCRLHMEYIAANGGVLTHEELRGSPGYSKEGADAARRAVLSTRAEAFGASGNAFEFAPLHLMQTLAPALSQMGVWGGCATTNVGADRKSSAPALYTYPGPGVTGFYAAEDAYESPMVPGDLVGLPRGTITGPHILVMSLAPGPGRIAGATLSGPAGYVEIRTVDNETAGLEGYMPPGGMLIPVRPLAPGTTYTAAATFQPSQAKDGALTRTWSFTTAGLPAPAPAAPETTGSSARPSAPVAVSLRLGNPRRVRLRKLRFTLTADPRLAGQPARVVMYRVVRRCAGGTCRDVRKGRELSSSIGRLAARQTLTAPRPATGRAIVVLVQTKAFLQAGVAFAASQAVARWPAR